MAKSSSTGPRFIPIHLHRSSDSATHAHGAVAAAASSSSSRYGAHSSTNGSSSPSPLPSLSSSSLRHGGSVALHRSSSVSIRSQNPTPPSSSSSSRSSSFKLSVPRPVNLPSLRREHSGNDPAVALVGGASGSYGWSKKQQSSVLPSTEVSSPSIDNENSASSSWSLHSQRMTSAANSAFFEQNESGHNSPGQAVVVRREDFPTLQASSTALPHHRKEAQPKQRDRQFELENHRPEQRDNLPIPEGHRSKQRETLLEPEDDRPKQRDKLLERDYPMRSQRKGNKEELLGSKETSSRGDILIKDEEHSLNQASPKLQPLSTQPRFKQPSSDNECCHETLDVKSQKISPLKSLDDAVGKSSTYEGCDHVDGKSSHNEACDEAMNQSNHYESRYATGKSHNHRFSGPSPLVRLDHTSSNWVDDERETLGSARLGGVEHVDRIRSSESTSMTMIPNHLSHGSYLVGSSSSTRNGPTGGIHKEFRDTLQNVGREGKFMKDVSREGPAGLDLHANEGSNANQRVGKSSVSMRDWNSITKDANNTGGANFSSSRSFSNLANNAYGRNVGSNSFRGDVDLVDNFGMSSAKQESGSRDAYLRKENFPNKNNVYRGQGRNGSSGTYFNPRDSFPRLNYGREERTHGLYRQDSLFNSSRNLQANSFFNVDSLVSSVGAKIFKKKKDEPIDYNDPAREQFEAELERVQKLQEQERQRAVEEREKAIELAAKEAEEQERIAKEEELFRMKLEEEAREAAAKAQREIEEAARKAMELRRAREEEKHLALVEEERRKEAARRKLMELEERISKRESMQKQRVPFVAERARNDVNNTEMDEANSGFSEMKHKDESSPPPCPVRREERETLENQNSQTRFPSVEGDRVVQISRKTNMDDVKGFSSLPLKPDYASDHRSQHVQVPGYKSLSFKETTIGLSWARSNASKQSELTIRKQQRWGSDRTEGLMGRNRSSDINARYKGDTKDWSGDGWGVENENKLQEKRLTSPAIPYYLNGVETDYPIVGKLRQSLPKQPRVPPPIFGHGLASIQKKVSEPEYPQSSSFVNGSNNSEGIENDTDVQEFPIKIEAQYRSMDDAQSSESAASPVSSEVSLLLNERDVPDNGVENELVHVCEEYQVLCLNEDEMSSEMRHSIQKLDVDEIQMASGMMEERQDAASTDDEWLEQTMEGESSVLNLHNSPSMETTDVPDDDADWENVNVLSAKTNGQHTTDVSEENLISHQIDEMQNCIPDEPEKPIDSQHKRDTAFISKCEAPMKVTTKDEAIHNPKIDQVEHTISVADISDSMQRGHLEGVNLNQHLFQQFQQPFSFMAVPLPQSTTLHSVAPHQSMLHSLHVQQDLPFQMGLLPSMPNAIQIGSIQMPLQVHPQITQIAHLHQQSPVFQFGQICHSVPFNQPISLNHHIESLAAVIDSSLGPALVHEEIDDKASAEKDVSVDANMHVGTEKRDLSSGEKNECNCIASKTIFQELGEFETPLACERDSADTLLNQSSLVDRVNSRQRNNHSTDYGVFGRGQVRWHNGNGFKSPDSISQTGSGEEEMIHKRIPRRNIQRTEYRARKPLPDIERNNGTDMIEETDLTSHHRASIEFNTANLPTSIKRKPDIHVQDSGAYAHSEAHSYSDAQSNRTSHDSLPISVGSRNNLVGSHMSNVQSEGISKFGAAGEIVFEDPSTEIHNNDDFINFRSKRQMLKEQHALEDKENPRDFKVKDQIPRKQQQVVTEEPAIASKNANEQWPTPKSDLIKYEMHANQRIGSSSSQYSPACSLAGTSIAEICDDVNQNTKPTTSGQCQSTSNASHINHGVANLYGHQSYSDAAGGGSHNLRNMNGAWGGQQFPHEVVNLTQIQLEEAMKPIRFDGMSSQLAPIMKGSAAANGSGIPLSSSLVDASISMPNPISSLLAGEKIQFGAVTSPTVRSCDNRSSSPSFIGTVGTPLSYALGMDTNITTNHSNHTRSFIAPDKNSVFTSATTENKVYNQVVDVEAEAEAAASAVAVAAIGSDEMAGSHSDADTVVGESHAARFAYFTASSGVDSARPTIIQAPRNAMDNEDSISVALPVDLSVESPSPFMSGSMPNVAGTAGFMLTNFPNRVSPFSCLEMGTILGGSIFTLGHHDEAMAAPLEPGSAGGWQQMQSSTSDSFYSPPAQFIRPTGIPNIQGHPHMLVYTNAFPPVGQFGQLGVSYMGTAYHPSGKQPDWTHTPLTSPLGTAYRNAGDVNAGFSSMTDPQHNTAASNNAQSFSVAGCSMMPMAAPISLFDPNMSTPFQAQWSRAPAPPFSNYSFSGQAPAPALSLQSRNLNNHPREYGLMHQPFHMNYNTHNHHHQHHQPLDANSSPFLPADIAPVPAVHFPDEISLSYSAATVNAPNLSSLSIKGDNHLSSPEEKRNIPPSSTR